jgi:methionyl-tRNA formyltransferase
VGEVTYADKLHRSDLELRWQSDAEVLARVVRVGGAWTTWRGRTFKVLEAWPTDAPPTQEPGSVHGDVVRCGTGGLRLVRVQPEGKPAMDFGAWANGAQPAPHERLGSPS